MKQEVVRYIVPGALCLIGLVMGIIDPDPFLRVVGWLLVFTGGFLAGKGGLPR